MNILIADDEVKMVNILSSYFDREGFNVFRASNGEEAIDVVHSHKIDLAILDWMMPKVSGVEACRYIKENSNTKVLILTAKGENEDEIEALDCGADEYVKKPFDTRILIKRAKRLLPEEHKLEINNLEIDRVAKKVYKDGSSIMLTKTEFDLLNCFLINKGLILSREKLIDLVWGLEYDGDSRTVDTHIRRLRTKIGEDNIKTYRGLGYSLEVDSNKDK
ncbi:response regulator transcription factor [Clostridium sardiniense]